MDATQINIVIGAVFVFLIIFFLVYRNYRMQIKKLQLFVESKRYKFYSQDTINLRKALEQTMFYNISRKPKPYNIIDTGTGKLCKITVGGRVSFTYTIYVDYIDFTDVMIFKRTLYSNWGFTSSPYAKYGFKEIIVAGLSEQYIVYAKNENQAVDSLVPIAKSLSAILGEFCFEISGKVFVCYNYKNRPKVDGLEDYINHCQKIKRIIEHGR